MTDQISELNLWLLQHQPDEFVWGWKDCNTYIVEYVDWLNNSQTLREVRGKYWDARSAFKFTRDYKKLNVGISEAGFTQETELQDGDIITYEKNGFVCGHIYAYNRVHSMDPVSGYVCIPIAGVNMADPKIKIWRHNG